MDHLHAANTRDHSNSRDKFECFGDTDLYPAVAASRRPVLSSRGFTVGVAFALTLALLAATLTMMLPSAFAASESETTTYVTLTTQSVTSSTLGSSVTVKGDNLNGVTSVKAVGVTATINSASPTRLVINVPVAKNYLAASGPIAFKLKSGYAWSTSSTRHTVKLLYKAHSAVALQMNYAMLYISKRKSNYPKFASNCQNYVSQTLVARGWKMSSAWYAKSKSRYSFSFVRVNTFYHLLKTSSAFRKKVTMIGGDTQAHRAKLKVGDLVFAHWNKNKKSVKWNHTMIVSKITKTAAGHIKIYMAGNTLNQRYRSLDALKASTRDYYGSGKHDYLTIKHPTFYFVSVK